MNNINPHSNPFLFEESEVRTATDDKGDIWFCAKDVFESLGITWSQRSGSLKSYQEKLIRPLYLQGQSGVAEVICISEPAVYKAIFSSRKPEAIKFADWVFEEVLPALRKQGHFGITKEIDQIKGTNAMVNLLGKLSNTTDAFAFQLLTYRLRNLCNALGEPMPDINLLGKDKNQLPLI